MRKCAYTGKVATSKDAVIPKKHLQNELHNWTKEVPVCNEYKNEKQDRMPTDHEMKIQETFYELELARMKVKYLENKLQNLQEVCVQFTTKKQDIIPSVKPTKGEKKKAAQIEKAYHQKDVVEEVEQEIVEYLKKRSMWD